MMKGKLKGRLNSIRNLREMLPQSQFFLVYQALVESHLRYSNPMWGHLPEKILYSLQKIQNRALYLIECAPVKGQIPLARRNVDKIIRNDRAMMVHKILGEKFLENLKGKFTYRTQILKYKNSENTISKYQSIGWGSQNRDFHTSVQRSGMRFQTKLEMWSLLTFSNKK